MSEDASIKTPDEIREEIKQTRDELGDTVEALGAKTDVKGQARERVESVKERVQHKTDELTAKAKDVTPASAQQSGQDLVAKVRENPAPVALAGAVALGYLVGRRAGR
ncbi:MAG: DUF3618 domain-containing protein [Solirubrobacteraceae bacterium]